MPLNREEILEKKRQYRADNADMIKQAAKYYYQCNREEILEK